MARRKKVKSITLFGRRWFTKRHGNTYHTVSIIVNGECVHKSVRAYGYGDSYEQTGAEWLDAEGHINREHYPNGSSESLWRYCEDNNIAYHRECADVAREKDL